MLSIPKLFPSLEAIELYIVEEPLAEFGESRLINPSEKICSFTQLMNEGIENTHHDHE